MEATEESDAWLAGLNNSKCMNSFFSRSTLLPTEFAYALWKTNTARMGRGQIMTRGVARSRGRGRGRGRGAGVIGGRVSKSNSNSNSKANIATAATSPISAPFQNMQPYWKWILSVHGKDVVKRYGSIRIVDEGRVPVGIVGVLRQGKVRWRG